MLRQPSSQPQPPAESAGRARQATDARLREAEKLRDAEQAEVAAVELAMQQRSNKASGSASSVGSVFARWFTG